MRRNGRGANFGFPVAALRVYLPRLIANGRASMQSDAPLSHAHLTRTRKTATRPLAG